MELIQKPEVAARLGKLQAWMRGADLDAVFVFQNVDLYYFAGTVQTGLLCLPVAGDPLYLVQKSLVRARQESPWDRLLPFPGYKKLAEWLASEGIADLRRVGIEADVLPTSHYLRLTELFPETKFIDASEAIRRIRMIKSDHEVGQIRLAAAMLREAFRRLPQWIRPGVTELEVMSQLEGFLRSLGHQGIVRMRGFNHQLGFGTLSSGASASHPTHFPGPVGCEGLYAAVPNGAGWRKIAPGETIVVDIVGGYGGYLADKTRTYVIEDPPRDMADAHGFLLALNREIESLLKPGTIGSHIYQHALRLVKDSPYASGFMGIGDSQVRFIGHGIGLELDELPVLAGGFDIPLEPGMTIAIEPKIFFPQRGGVGIENTYLVTNSGFEKLTEFPEDIIRIAIDPGCTS
jgi:Xaa-Pro dipeptidase